MDLSFQREFLPVITAEETDVIHDRMLALMREYDSDIDTQVGSPSYDTTRPSAEETNALQRLVMDGVLAVIPSTSYGEYLDGMVIEAGVTRKPGDQAEGTVFLQAFERIDVPENTMLWTDGDVRFFTQADVTIMPLEVQPDPENESPGEIEVPVIAELVGRDGNISPGTLRNIAQPFQGLVTIRQPNAMTGGLDAESDDDLRARYFAVIRNRSGAGNPDNYKGWALEVNGTKATKVFRATPSPGSVTIAVASQEGVPDSTLVDEVQALIDARANVLSNNIVVPATALAIDMAGTLTLMPDTLLADVQTAFEESVTSYLESLYYTGEPVRYSSLYQLLLNTTGVLDVSDFLVNNAVANVLAENTDIAVLGTVTFT